MPVANCIDKPLMFAASSMNSLSPLMSTAASPNASTSMPTAVSIMPGSAQKQWLRRKNPKHRSWSCSEALSAAKASIKTAASFFKSVAANLSAPACCRTARSTTSRCTLKKGAANSSARPFCCTAVSTTCRSAWQRCDANCSERPSCSTAARTMLRSSLKCESANCSLHPLHFTARSTTSRSLRNSSAVLASIRNWCKSLT
mmetsp:Transcript_42984/g.118875  ORF Transcript_42984/g.118875 Transcript_42984/m.118875 type:complete len:201 (+) Transcript_42984:1437-2039(+)